MDVTPQNLASLRAGFSSLFQQGLGQAKAEYERICTVVPATTKEQKYGWLGKLPNVREWIGARVVQNLAASDYAIKEKALELTIGVDRDDIETDNLGIYNPLFIEMGRSTGDEFGRMVYAQLKAGFTTNCYDGQFFFDTDHPVILADGTMGVAVNTDGGAGTPWFLLDTTRAIRPIMLQKRKDFSSVLALDREGDQNVFFNKEFIYGSDARANTGYGFWQMAWGSRQALTAATYELARTSIMGMKGDYGRPLGLTPNLLVVPPALEGAARKLLNSEYATAGETNPWKGTAELMVAPWLA